MKKNLFLLPLLLLLQSCFFGGSKTNATLKISSSFIFSGQTGGVVLYLINKDTNTQRAISLINNQIVLELDNGNWDFAALGWDGSSPLTGSLSCAKKSVVLGDSDANISLSLNASTCDDNFFSPPAYRVNNLTNTLRLINCSVIQGATSGSNCDNSNRGIGSSYRVKILATPDVSINSLGTLNYGQLDSLKTSCIISNGTPNSITNTGIKLPFGGTGLKLSTVIETFKDSSCSTPLKQLFYPFGLGGTQQTDNLSTIFISTGGFGDVFLELGIISVAGILDFGTNVAGNGSVPQEITISNTSPDNFNAFTISLAAPFTFVGGTYPGVGGTCATTLASNSNCKIIIQFPNTTVGTYSSSLAISFNNGENQTTSRIVSANTIQPATLVLSNNTFSFGNVINSSSRNETFTITNSGQTAASTLNLSFNGTGATQFSQSNNCGTSIAAGASCSITIVFSPNASNAFSANAVISYNNSITTQNASLALSGSGVELIAGNFILPPTTITNTSTQTFTLTNGTSFVLNSLNISVASPFTRSGGSCGTLIPVGASCTIIINFTSSSAGTFSGTLNIGFDNGNSQNISKTLTATALTAASISLNSSSFDYSGVLLNTTKSQTFTITNSGQTPASSLTFSMTGTNAAAFTQTSNTCSNTLGASSSCLITILFSPDQEASFSANLIPSYGNGLSTQSLNVALAGTGTDLQVLNGSVTAMVKNGSNLIIAGNFTRISPRSGGGLILKKSSCSNLSCLSSGISSLSTMPKVAGTVYSTISDGAGGFYIGGSFSKIGSMTRNNIARILSNGAVDSSFNPNVSGMVNTMLLSGGTLYVGGDFYSIGGQTRHNLAALNPTSGSVLSLNIGTNGIHSIGTIRSLASDGTTLYVGGQFTTLGTESRKGLGAITLSSGVVTSFDSGADNSEDIFTAVNSIYLLGSSLYVGGDFTDIGGSARRSFAEIDTSTGLATSFNPSPSTSGFSNDSTINAIEYDGTNLWASGYFSSIGGQTRNNLAVIDISTGLASSVNPSLSGSVSSLKIDGSTLYVGGYFNSIGGQSRNHIAAIDVSTGLATSFDPNTNGGISAIAFNATNLFVGGSFTGIGGVTRNYIAEMSLISGQPTSFNPNPNGGISSLILDGSTLYVGGGFSSVGGQTRNNIAAINTSTSLAASFNPNSNGPINSMLLESGVLYVGGNFSNIGGSNRTSLAAINTSTSLATSFSTTMTEWSPIPETISSLALNGSTLYVAGQFSSIGGETRNCLAALSTSTGLATTFNPNPTDPSVMGSPLGCEAVTNSMILDSGYLYVGGSFTQIGGASRNRIAQIDTSTGLATAFDPDSTNEVNKMFLIGGDLYVAANGTIGAQSINGIAKINISNGTTTNLNLQTGLINAFLIDGSNYVFGGNFSTVKNEARGGLGIVGY